MKPNPKDKESLLKFFEDYQGLTNNEMSIIAGVSVWTILNWKRKCGFIQPKAQTVVKAKETPPPDWDTKEWFEKTYKKHGLRAIAAILGRSWHFVARRLKIYNIPIKKHSERVKSDNPCCDDGWLHYYYADRNDYLEWCKKNNIDPCEEGGQRLAAVECADLANASIQTIHSWLALFKMKIRDSTESKINLKRSYATRRKHRDNLFKLYRAGKKYIAIGSDLYSNGTKVDQKKTNN